MKYMSLVMMFAKCSNDLMNTSNTGKQRNMKEKYTVLTMASQILIISQENVFLHAYQNIFDL